MKGPGLFLAQYVGDRPPFDTLDGLATFAAGCGFTAVQMPTTDSRLIDLPLAASSKDYCDELRGKLAAHGLEVSELSTHLQGQLLATHPAHTALFEHFAPAHLHGRPEELQAWAAEQLQFAARASRNLGLSACASFSGSLLWPYLYPWPARPAGLVESAFHELARRWRPLLDAFDKAGTDVCFELHPTEDLHDGASFERFLDVVDHHPRACILYDPSHLLLQHIDYVGFVHRYHARIRAFHVKDAEYRRSDSTGVYGGYLDWIDRAGRFRSVGDGQIDFSQIFAALIQHGYTGYAVLEWECCLKDSIRGAREGADFIRRHLFKRPAQAFDSFSAGRSDPVLISRLLGLNADVTP
ncbi:MAG: sugar phosphate isomerase/epimerase [Rhodanobacteraceae bacterium]|nr:sugar phosphate isomerase/epimerase [Rhodanobacteraceae bacterium]